MHNYALDQTLPCCYGTMVLIARAQGLARIKAAASAQRASRSNHSATEDGGSTSALSSRRPGCQEQLTLGRLQSIVQRANNDAKGVGRKSVRPGGCFSRICVGRQNTKLEVKSQRALAARSIESEQVTGTLRGEGREECEGEV
jgi:hypothetical protein